MHAAAKAADKKDKLLWIKPTPPEPFLMHLGIIARTHDIIEFQENFPTEYANFYIDRCENILLLW